VTLIGNRAPALLTQLLSRKFTDEDINEDLNYLYDFLNKEAAKMSTWDEYLSEVKSGKLEWSPVHTSEQFWRQVVAKEGRFHEKDYEVLRHLTKILNGIAPTGMPVAASGSGSGKFLFIRQ
jgi:V-type H+-transporting ATPase subunit H